MRAPIGELRLLLVAPGPRHSTYDVYRYYATALARAAGIAELIEFPFHERLDYHLAAARALGRGLGPGPLPLALQAEIERRAADELLPLALAERPDAILVVDGTQLPRGPLETLRSLADGGLLPSLLALYFTEAPYLEEQAYELGRWADLVLLHERDSVPRLRARLPHSRVERLPHSYSRDVHRPAAVPLEPLHDLYFCGTFFPERARFLSRVAWGDRRVLLAGHWPMAAPQEQLALEGRLDPSPRANPRVARDYRRSRVVLNLHRSGWGRLLRTADGLTPDHASEQPSASSIGPRPLEAAACGAFQLSDPRAEIAELFGDSIPLFRSAQELEHLIERYLPDPQARAKHALEARRRIAGMSYDDRAGWLVDLLGDEIARRRDRASRLPQPFRSFLASHP